MTNATQSLSLDLPVRSVLRLADASELDIECTGGTLWITLDHDRRDIVLEAGQRFHANAHRAALVEALAPSCLRLRGQWLRPTPAPVQSRVAPQPLRHGSKQMLPA